MKKLESRVEIDKFLNGVDTFLLDCDGVLWHGNALLPSVLDTLAFLRKQNKRLLFVSNNSTKSRAGYAKKFHSLGMDWVTAGQIIPSSFASAFHLSSILKFPADKRIYVVGEEGLCEELEAHGIKWTGGPNDRQMWKESEEAWRDEVKPDDSIGAVLVGFDRYINYQKLSKAATYIRYNNATFYATNDDSTFPAHGRLFPGSGCNVEYVSNACGQRPKMLFGKPHQPMMQAIVAANKLDIKRTCMVGDRLNTDIQFGNEAGMQSLLVMTGVTKHDELSGHFSDNQEPQYLSETFADLFLKQ
eukprot:Partr_v1_DN25508_c0_g1_i2_m20940 putative -phosphatase